MVVEAIQEAIAGISTIEASAQKPSSLVSSPSYFNAIEEATGCEN